MQKPEPQPALALTRKQLLELRRATLQQLAALDRALGLSPTVTPKETKEHQAYQARQTQRTTK